MYTNTVAALQEEILRLLDQQEQRLEEMLNVEDFLFGKNEDVQSRSLDQKKASLWMKTLSDEKAKVNNLEMTLAVVGTMKAGKSTTINAIIGREVLPNRNRPMTTLPTIIRHKSGQHTPQLTFPNPQPFNKALAEISKKLLHIPQEKISELSIYSSEDGKRLVESIRLGELTHLESNHTGVEGVYEFLKSINDISRMCDAQNFNLPSPLTEYKSISEFPIIEIEFFHLKNADQSVAGNLALIDTPGPNEAGQSHLRHILEEQLQKASAVLSVLDYTQLSSEADAEVRSEIEKVAELSGDRLFVLVNKYDQKDRNSMGKDEVKSYVSQELFKDMVTPTRIFPVSSRSGYLANYALSEIDRNHKLPSPTQEDWVEDFAKQVFGETWDIEEDQEDLNDIDRIQKSAERLWSKSNFVEPLDLVIGKAYGDAALIALKSAIAKMVHYNTEIIQYLKMRNQSADLDIKVLQQFIEQLNYDIHLIEKVQEESDQLGQEAGHTLNANISIAFEAGENSLKKYINEFFEKGKINERMEQERQKHPVEKNDKGIFVRIFDSVLSEPKRGFASLNSYKPDSDTVNKFSSKDEADKFLYELHSVLEKDSANLIHVMQQQVADFTKQTEEKLKVNIQSNIDPILKEAALTLNDTFDLQVSFKEHSINSINIDFDDIMKGMVEEKSESVTKYRTVRKWYTLWLKQHEESYSVNQNFYYVDTKKIGKDVLTQLATSQNQLKRELEKYIQKELINNLNSYFSELKAYLDKFRGNLLDGLADKQEDEFVLGKLLVAMQKFLEDSHVHDEDLKQLNPESIMYSLSHA
ncbi:dynamin family protein [Saccharibacillus sp. O23]|uniref:dynamin family protein n=1 Tax=Saccharibacillus sp. O23 TaxID=2009338 RepID=UPI0015C616F2|nr:dynamin family protein [Saccharibacillus sp. O23]